MILKHLRQIECSISKSKAIYIIPLYFEQEMSNLSQTGVFDSVKHDIKNNTLILTMTLNTSDNPFSVCDNSGKTRLDDESSLR